MLNTLMLVNSNLHDENMMKKQNIITINIASQSYVMGIRCITKCKTQK